MKRNIFEGKWISLRNSRVNNIIRLRVYSLHGSCLLESVGFQL